MAKDSKIEYIMKKYEEAIAVIEDLTAESPPSKIFYLLADKLSYLLDADIETAVRVQDIVRCRKCSPLIKALGSHFLLCPQVIENRNFLRNPESKNIQPDQGITLPKEPVIWASNHAFKDDALGTVLAIKRHAYILFGSLPQFFNTFDGITAWLNGVVMVNRKSATSRHTAVSKAVRVMQLGTDLIVYPEGVWNKSPNALVADLWPGIYRIACETGAKVVPVAHYLHDFGVVGKDNLIHTVMDEPVRIDNLSERTALTYLRDILAEWFYRMMEVYGKTSRAELLKGASSGIEVWEKQLKDRIAEVIRYDKENEIHADYQPKWKVLPQDVWRPVAGISNVTKDNALFVQYARQLMLQLEQEDFQHRF